MARILAVGIATLDIINHVSTYPDEDDEVRALSQQRVRGGNASNTLVVLSQLGHQCDWAGVLVNEPDTAIITQDLQQHQINYSHGRVVDSGKMPTSYITLSEMTGSRTIVHHRDCPELDFEHFKALDLSHYDWVHFEGRNIGELTKMLGWLRQHHPHTPCSLEVEKPRADIEALFEHTDLIMFSRPYAKSRGFDSAADFLHSLELTAMTSCTWGDAGAWLKQQDHMFHSPAFPPARIIDTLGAGDTYNAGLISALVQRQPAQQALMEACQLAGRKCGQNGYNNLVASA